MTSENKCVDLNNENTILKKKLVEIQFELQKKHRIIETLNGNIADVKEILIKTQETLIETQDMWIKTIQSQNEGSNQIKNRDLFMSFN